MEEAEKKIYNKWRLKILSLVIIGYGAYYLCRQNFSMIMPAYIEESGHSKIELGSILSAASIVYGVGKFANGYFSDKSNARYFLSVGLLLSGVITFILGFSNNLWFLAFFWILNNWIQSMGWPPIARMLTYWFAPNELGRKWALGAASHQIGGGLTILLAGYLVANFGWRYAFFIPGIISSFIAFILFYYLRESPMSVGLSSVEIYKNIPNNKENNLEENASMKEIFASVFINKKIWLISCSNICVYIVRVGIVFWAPLFLKEFKNISLTHAGWQVAAYEIFGLLGGLSAGWLSDKIFNGARGPIGALFLLFLALSLILFWKMPEKFDNFSAFSLILVGFFVYGPQVLIGVASADFASKKAIGTANGFVGTMGYVGSAISGAGVGWLVDNLGWDSVFIFFFCSALIGAYLFFLTWER
jgi:OPA family glycerol-3-phosphate transporter-like MFS transporter